MPPLVDAGPAPMNISVVITSSVGSFIPPMSTVLNPAVLGVTPWNQPARSLSNVSSGPNVFGLVHSNVITTSGPTTRSPAVATNVILVCRLHGSGLDAAPDRRWRSRRQNSTRIGNPRPPTMNAPDTLSTTTGSPTNRAKLSEYSEMPALLNEAIEWNTAE